MKTNSAFAHLVLGLCVTCAALGQASFGFRNYDPGYGIDVPVFDAQGQLLVGSDYRAELWGGGTPDSLAPLFVLDEGNRREILPFNERGRVISTTAYLSVLTVPPSGWAWLQMRAWDARLGATYEEVTALDLGGYGESSLFYAHGGNPLLIPASLPGPLIGLQSFNLRPIVPEPSTCALLVLGGAAVCWIVRRERQGRS